MNQSEDCPENWRQNAKVICPAA
ncbi:hypothetical protein [Desulfatitalea tepidiphila]